MMQSCGYSVLLGNQHFSQCSNEYLHKEKKLLEERLKETPPRMPWLGLSTRKALKHCSLQSRAYSTLVSVRKPAEEVSILSSPSSHPFSLLHTLRCEAVLL